MIPETQLPAFPVPSSQRLMSLDALCGFDMFWILGADSFVIALHEMSQTAPTKFLMPRLYIIPAVRGTVVTWAGPGTLQAAALVTGPYVDVVTTSPYTNTAASQNYFSVRR